MTEKDFNQIADLLIARLGNGIVDARRLSKAVRKFGLERGLLTLVNGKYQLPLQSSFITELETPCETILILMERDGVDLDTGIGKSITKAEFWNYLDINNSKYSLYCERDRLAQERLLIRLHQAGLIYFQAAGSLWDIRKAI